MEWWKLKVVEVSCTRAERGLPVAMARMPLFLCAAPAVAMTSASRSSMVLFWFEFIILDIVLDVDFSILNDTVLVRALFLIYDIVVTRDRAFSILDDTVLVRAPFYIRYCL